MSTATCPYCDAEVEIYIDGAWGAETGIIYQEECDECGKTFGFETDYEIYHSSKALPCANGDAHLYKINRVSLFDHYFLFGYLFSMRCRHCKKECDGPFFNFDDSADLTQAEQFGLVPKAPFYISSSYSKVKLSKGANFDGTMGEFSQVKKNV